MRSERWVLGVAFGAIAVVVPAVLGGYALLHQPTPAEIAARVALVPERTRYELAKERRVRFELRTSLLPWQEVEYWAYGPTEIAVRQSVRAPGATSFVADEPPFCGMGLSPYKLRGHETVPFDVDVYRRGTYRVTLSFAFRRDGKPVPFEVESEEFVVE